MKTLTRAKRYIAHKEELKKLADNKLQHIVQPVICADYDIREKNGQLWPYNNIKKKFLEPVGNVGDILWIAEAAYFDQGSKLLRYSFDDKEFDVDYTKIMGKSPPTFISSGALSRPLSRFQVKIIDIKIEKLESMSKTDMINLTPKNLDQTKPEWVWVVNIKRI